MSNWRRFAGCVPSRIKCSSFTSHVVQSLSCCKRSVMKRLRLLLYSCPEVLALFLDGINLTRLLQTGCYGTDGEWFFSLATRAEHRHFSNHLYSVRYILQTQNPSWCTQEPHREISTGHLTVHHMACEQREVVMDSWTTYCEADAADIKQLNVMSYNILWVKLFSAPKKKVSIMIYFVLRQVLFS